MTDKALQSIVPSRELCEQIPAGKFADSVLVWHCTMFLSSMPPKQVWEVLPRNDPRICGTPDAPAPTLEEILEDLVVGTSSVEVSCIWQGGWHVDGDGIEKYNFVSSVTAAMKLWLEIEGMDHA